ncbi:hypothetical protein [Burkholderia arboris]|uniref:Uncharacterized protein n=1 Tax=Burkholderia arboris TaxID=488730 RepID=A0ABZ3DGT6_9BURK|nr:hypothetical protein [Burkholderia arboris]MCA8493533.1 hypothetical protein [Burkholderia arboris]UTV55001.1 hypothetical protein NLX30_01070 [Burkholderia arboris]
MAQGGAPRAWAHCRIAGQLIECRALAAIIAGAGFHSVVIKRWIIEVAVSVRSSRLLK